VGFAASVGCFGRLFWATVSGDFEWIICRGSNSDDQSEINFGLRFFKEYPLCRVAACENR